MADKYHSPYLKTVYTGTIRIRNPETGKMEEVTTTRTVYQNTEIDPNMVIPKGTKLGNEVIQEDTTNLERMAEGKSPAVTIEKEDGSIGYERIELHHLTGRELQPETAYFTGELQDGTLVEIRTSVHDAQQLHNLGEKNNSFRKVKVETVDENGTAVRTMERSYGAAHYDKVRSQYWQDRAAAFVQSETETHDKGGNNMGWLDKLKGTEPEKQETETQSFADQRQSFLDSLKVDVPNNQTQNNTNGNNDDNNNTSAPDPAEVGDAKDEPSHAAPDEESGLESDNDGMDIDDGMEP